LLKTKVQEYYNQIKTNQFDPKLKINQIAGIKDGGRFVITLTGHSL